VGFDEPRFRSHRAHRATATARAAAASKVWLTAPIDDTAGLLACRGKSIVNTRPRMLVVHQQAEEAAPQSGRRVRAQMRARR
jgi:hypothetical protein